MTDPGLSHDSIRELLPSVALGAASPEERDIVRAHVASCAECREELASLELAAASLGVAAPERPLPDLAAVRARLLARVEGRGSRVESRVAEPPSRRVAESRPATRDPRLIWALAASVALFVCAALLANAIRGRKAAESRLVAARAEAQAEIARLSDSLAASAALVKSLTGPAVEVVSLAASGPKEPRGWMFWDQPAGRWTLVTRDLPTLAPGRTYQLWVITTAGQKVSAGTFQPTNGRALVQATYELPRNALGAIAVTEEPAGGVPQPTGAIVISGAPG